MVALRCLHPQAQPAAVDAQRADPGAPAVAQLGGQVPGEGDEDLGMRLLEVGQPVVLQPAERVRPGRREVDGRERGAAVAVGEHGRTRIQTHQRGSVTEVEQPLVRADVRDLQRHPARRPLLGHPQPPGDPEQPADGFTQVHRRPVGELQHHGGLPAADAVEQRVVVGEQQHRRSVGAHVVHQRRHRRGAGADERGVASAHRQAAGAFGVGGCGRTPEPRASHGYPL